MASSAAIIDIASNSIKVLVAARDATSLQGLKSKTIDARISAGISKATPMLSEDGMVRGLAAIQELLADVAALSPDKIVLVATSAVRDASNGEEFRTRVQSATGHQIRILTGDEEASFIGRGLICDPALGELRDFYVFDLGGGSLECLLFQNRKIRHAISLRLGCVRLTERFISDTNKPLSSTETDALASHVRAELKHSAFPFFPTAPAAIFTGGTMTTVRALRAALTGVNLEDSPAEIETATLSALIDKLVPLTLDQRKAIPGMPAARADVFPAALVTMQALANFAHIDVFHHSLYNLRWGVAAEALGS